MDIYTTIIQTVSAHDPNRSVVLEDFPNVPPCGRAAVSRVDFETAEEFVAGFQAVKDRAFGNAEKIQIYLKRAGGKFVAEFATPE